LALLTDRFQYRDAAEDVLQLQREAMARYPLGFARALNALDFFLDEPREIAVVGPADALPPLRRAVFEPFVPNKVVAGGGADIPLLQGREVHNGSAIAYVCHQYVCQAPTSDPEQLRKQLLGEVMS
jgi:uncharacterized protein